jgi:hypothetical protein
MANAYIREYARVAIVPGGGAIPVPMEPPVATQTVSFTTATQSAALNDATHYVLVTADAAHNMLGGDNPTASATVYPLFTADTERFFGVKPGTKLSFYDGSS